MKLKVNDFIPEANIYILKDGEPKEQNIKEILGNSKVLYLDCQEHTLPHILNFIYQGM